MDVLLFGFTQEAARIIEPGWNMNPLGNWWFILSIVVLFTPLIWYLTDRVIEPRLGKWGGTPDEELKAELAKSALTPRSAGGCAMRRRGAADRRAVYRAVDLAGLHAADRRDQDGNRSAPAFLWRARRRLLPLFLLTGIAFGAGVGSVKSYRDVLPMMIEGIRTLAPYIAFVFFAAHFVAMFNWSRLGPILAIDGALVLRAMELPAPLLLVSVLLMSSFLDLFIGSAAAKWSALAPVVVPMFMLLGISPEMTTAAYRMGDSYTNIMTPLMSYFPLILAFARRWDNSMGVGSLLALMLPYALTFMAFGIALTVAWVAFDWPLGPGAQVYYQSPVESLP
jgi:aminobenzoyl-glutamate transport protein